MSSKRRIRRKACKGKRRYATAAEAGNAAWHVDQKSALGGRVLHAYRCKFCNGYHFGHMPIKNRSRA